MTQDSPAGKDTIPAEETTGPGTTPDAEEAEQLVPAWLAVLVLVLLLAVVATGGYIVRGIFSPADPVNQEERDIRKWESLAEQSPYDPSVLLSLGSAYQRAGRLRDAVTQYDKVLEIQPNDTAALYNRAAVLMEQGKDKLAVEQLWDVLERDPEHVAAAKMLGEYYGDRGQYRSLIAAVRPVVEVKESSADLQYLMGVAYENLGRLDWAEARYRLALRYYPDMPEAHTAMERLGVEP